MSDRPPFWERRRQSLTERQPPHPTLGGVQPVAIGSSRAVFRTPAFRWFLGSTIATTTGLWFFEISLYWVAITRTHSGTATGLILTALVVPILFLVVPMGIVTDRWGDRRLLMLSQAAWFVMMVVAAIGASRGLLTFPVALAFALADGVVDAVWVVPAQVLLARVVERPLMAKAIALGTLQVALGRIVGGYGSGYVLSVGGPTMSCVVGTACLALGLLAMSRVKPAHALAARHEGVGLREAFRFVKEAPPAVALYAIGSTTALCLYGYLSVLPVVARDVLRSGPEGLGLMTAAGGIGTLAAVGIIDTIGRRFGRGRCLIGSVSLASAAMAILAISQSVAVSVMLAGIVTGALIFYSATNTTLLQALAPPELRGRVLAFFGFAFWGLMPVGSLGAGYVTDRLGVRSALLVMALMAVIGLALISAVYRPLVLLDVSADGAFGMRPTPVLTEAR